MMIRFMLALLLSLSATAMYHPDKNTWAVTDAAYAYLRKSSILFKQNEFFGASRFSLRGRPPIHRRG